MNHAGPDSADSDPSAIDQMEWIRVSLGGDGLGSPQQFLARPSVERPELLIPLDAPKVAAAALGRYHDDRSIPQRLAAIAGQTAGRLNLARTINGDIVELPPFNVVEQIARALGEPILYPAVAAGPPRRNRKPVVQLIRPDGTSVGFAKVGWSKLTKGLIGNEARWLKAVDGKMPAQLKAPAVLLDTTFVADAHTGTGPNDVKVVVTSQVRTTPWSTRRSPISETTLVELARVVPGGCSEFTRLGCIAEWREGPLKSLVDLDALIEKHCGTDVEVGLWHGDLTPWNTATNRGITSVWDWEFANDERPIGFDVLHMNFETVRRQSMGNELSAIDHILKIGPQLLTGLPGVKVSGNGEAIIDLYLCELLARETHLAGQGWQPQHLAPLDVHLITTLESRVTGHIAM